jgi:hypothetical protein
MKTNPSTRFPYIRLFFIGAALLGAASLAFAYADACHEKSEATQFLAALSTVKVGRSTEKEVLDATKSFSRYKDRAGKSDRQGRDAGVAYTFRNRALALLHLAPPTFIYAGVEFRDGVVVKKSVNFYQEPRFGVVVQEVVASEGSASTNVNSRQVRTNVYGPNSAVIDVHDDTSVPLSRRQLDWQIDFSCMTAIVRCSNPQVLLPGIFPKRS